jgi:hypothetical protein
MKIALVQFYSYHEEVLAPQINFLLPDNELYIAAPKDAFSNDYIRPFHNSIKKFTFNDKKYNNRLVYDIPLRIFSILYKYFQLYIFIKKEDIKLLIFNTINKQFHFKLIRFYFRNVDKIHVIHNAQLFTTKRTIKALAMFKKNLFISIDVLNFYQKKFPHIDKKNINWFFPGLNNLISSNKDEKNYCKDKIVIVVPGSVDCKRRNYEGLIDFLQKLDLKNVPFHIIFLGKISMDNQKMLINKGVNHIIETYTEYIPGKTMLHIIKNADAIAFLIDSSIGANATLYNKYKATGTAAFCLSFGIPCITSNDYTLNYGLENKAVVYEGSHIETVFNDIITGKLSKAYFKELRERSIPSIYSLEYQRSHYRSMIGIESTASL